MKHNNLVLASLIAVVGFSATSPCDAADRDPFAVFPESCATQAREIYSSLKEYRSQHGGSSGQGTVHFDYKSAATVSLSKTLEASAQLDSGMRLLLYRGVHNTIKPRISNRESQEARKIEQSLNSNETVSLAFVGFEPWTESKGDHFKCVTDTCPKGASCTVLDVKKEGNEILASLPTLRRYSQKVFRWASSVKIFGSKVDRRKAAYDRDEAELKEQIAGLPTKLVIIDVVMPVR
jgi:hypothetical protein